nr:hypothetical protein [Streptomyces sp. HNM0574]
MDGTLSDARHRLPYLETRPRNWKAFFRAAPDDPPLPTGVRLALRWAETSDLVYVTGRPESCRRDTERWLAGAGLPEGEVRMRPARDFRPAQVTKLELLRALAAERTVAVAVDDDERVCAAYEQAGFEVVRADWMPGAETLDTAQETEGRT